MPTGVCIYLLLQLHFLTREKVLMALDSLLILYCYAGGVDPRMELMFQAFTRQAAGPPLGTQLDLPNDGKRASTTAIELAQSRPPGPGITPFRSLRSSHRPKTAERQKSQSLSSEPASQAGVKLPPTLASHRTELHVLAESF